MLPLRELPADVVVADGIDLPGEWHRFELFEALHHTMRICNPMTSGDLDAVVDALDPAEGDSVLDLACGYGELTIRLAQRAAIQATGIDLSPWMISAAATRCGSGSGVERAATFEWVVGDAKRSVTRPHDIVACLGASWIWFGFAGTARAIAERTRPGGRIAIGDMRIRDGCDPVVVAEHHGRVSSIDEHIDEIERHGVEVIDQIDTSDDSWDDYLARTEEAVLRWRTDHPGERADRYVKEQHEWQSDHQRDRSILTWTVWVGQKRSRTVSSTT